MPIKSKEGATDNPFSKVFSKQMQDSFEKHFLLHDRALELRNSSGFLYPVKSAQELRGELSRSMETISKITPEDKIDAILLGEMGERLRIMDVVMDMNIARNFDYKRIISGYGIVPSDIKSFEERFKALDYNRISEEWLTVTGKSFSDKPEGIGDTDKIKESYDKFLRISFDTSSSMLRGLFKDFDDYMKTVQFTVKDNSFHRMGMIYLSKYSTDIISIRKGLRYTPIMDVMFAAGLVGEEGLLGHQGQFLVNEIAPIPGFLKRSFNPATTASVETLGNFGRQKMMDELCRNPGIIQGISEEDFTFIKKRSELEENYNKIKKFVNIYEQYCYFENGMDADKAEDALYSILPSPRLLSAEQRAISKAYLGSFAFWKSDDKRLWAYVAADMLHEMINDKLGTLSKDSSEKISEFLQLGYWTKKGFEQYFDYLVERFA